MTPQTQARQQIDPKLEQADGVNQGMKQLNLAAGLNMAGCPGPHGQPR